MNEVDILEREALRCWQEGIVEVNRGVARMERAYSLREKAFELRLEALTNGD